MSVGRLRRWCESSVIERIFRHLVADHGNAYMMADSTIVRAHQHNAGARKKGGADQAIGRSRSGLTTKIHTIVDAAGKAVALSLTPAQRADIIEAEPLLDKVDPRPSSPTRLTTSLPSSKSLKSGGSHRLSPPRKTDAIPGKSCSHFIRTEISSNASSPD